MPSPRAAGFSLIELVVVLLLMAALAMVSVALIRQPIDASIDVQNRARLADAADQAMTRLSRDIRLALPNSIRTSADGRAIELLLAPMGGRYRARLTAAGTGDVLDFAAADASFDLLAPLSAAPVSGQWAVVYNLTANGSLANAWAGDNRASIGSGSTTTHVLLSPAFQFPFASPSQRVYIVDQAVQYRCTTDGRLLRHAGFAPTAAMQVPPAAAEALIAEGVSFCDFRSDAGNASRQGLAMLSLALSREGESVNLLKSVHFPNLP